MKKKEREGERRLEYRARERENGEERER